MTIENGKIREENFGYTPLFAKLEKHKTRILRPVEYELLRNSLKQYKADQLDAILATGMRYVEFKRFIEAGGSWLDNNKRFIHMPFGSVKKGKIRKEHRARDIILSDWGKDAVMRVIKQTNTMPSTESWYEMLQEHADDIGLEKEGINIKFTRKTWESWLFASFPEKVQYILSSQGHTSSVSIQHYMNVGFIEDDIKAMQKFVIGWEK